MQIIPVIDVLGGEVVRAVAGRRTEYRKWESPLCNSCDPLAVAEAFRNELGLAEIYLADLDAIAGAAPNWNLYQRLVATEASLWIDAGLTDIASARRFAHFAQAHPAVTGVVAGLETIQSLAALAELINIIGAERAIFSLDLFDGQPRVVADAFHSLSPPEIIRAASGVGLKRWIVLDVALVGTGGGPAASAPPACRQIKRQDPTAFVATGGGIRSAADLSALQAAGADAALIATALHDGRFGRQELAMLAER